MAKTKVIVEINPTAAVTINAADEIDPTAAVTINTADEIDPTAAVAINTADEIDPTAAVAINTADETNPTAAVTINTADEIDPTAAVSNYQTSIKEQLFALVGENTKQRLPKKYRNTNKGSTGEVYYCTTNFPVTFLPSSLPNSKKYVPDKKPAVEKTTLSSLILSSFIKRSPFKFETVSAKDFLSALSK